MAKAKKLKRKAPAKRATKAQRSIATTTAHLTSTVYRTVAIDSLKHGFALLGKAQDFAAAAGQPEAADIGALRMLVRGAILQLQDLGKATKQPAIVATKEDPTGG